MGLSTKQVSGDHGIDWSQTLLQPAPLEVPKPPPTRRQQPQQPPPERLKCPRCESTNTKFCYYNNYNKSQPRHYCKACKRHWTKGGTLRNVPVGGGRKNRRLKTSNSTTTTEAASTTNKGNALSVNSQQQNISDVLYQAMIRPQSSFQLDKINSFHGKTLMGSNGAFTGSTISAPQNQNPHFSFSNLSSFDTNPSSIPSSFRSLNEYNYIEKLETMEDSTITTTTTTTTNTTTPFPTTTSTNIFSQPWQISTSSCMVDMPNYWNWNDLDMLSADLNIPWDETEIKSTGI
ncbi:unnamed protein product [Ilex paraguariensis]|uniref:Dof zinc finger protein n=1 Tax=Ilex paraguariensis TaxID=185542 RepID=A0ABC8UV43_9AQUA